MKFNYYAEDAEHSSTVVVTRHGYLLEVRRGSVTGPGRKFQTIGEWILRMRGKGRFQFPRTVGIDFRGDSVKYYHPEKPDRKKTLIWWEKKGVWLQVAPEKKVIDNFSEWMRAQEKGYYVISQTGYDIITIYHMYLASGNPLHLARFLLENADELIPVVEECSDMAQEIHTFLDSAPPYDEAIRKRYFPQSPLSGSPVEREKPPTDESDSYHDESHESLQEFYARFRASIVDERFITSRAFRSSLLYEQIQWIEKVRHASYTDFHEQKNHIILWGHALENASTLQSFR